MVEQLLLKQNDIFIMNSGIKSKSPAKMTKKYEAKQSANPNKIYNPKLHQKKYFCHYSNAVYMGGIDCFKKQGKGIIFMDDGACAITQYTHDVMVGHNIIFKDRSLTSILVSSNRSKSVCYRTGPYLLYLNFTRDNRTEGLGIFIQYFTRKIYKLKFEDGELIVKQRLTNSLAYKEVFDQNNLKSFIQKQHINAINVNIKVSDEIKCVSLNDKHVIGFTQQSNKKQFLANGLCFKVTVRKEQSNFDVILDERGYLEKEVINYFGERHFENGNYYIGEFKMGKFQGKGLLIYPKQMKWTYGFYKYGELKDVIESSVNSKFSCQEILINLHKQLKPCLQIKIKLNPFQQYLRSALVQIDIKDPLEFESVDYTNWQQKKDRDLKVIQVDYTINKYSSRTQQALKDLLSHKQTKIGSINGDQTQSRLRMNKSRSQHKFKPRVHGSEQKRRNLSKSSIKLKHIEQVQQGNQQNPQFKVNRNRAQADQSTHNKINQSIHRELLSNKFSVSPQQQKSFLPFSVNGPPLNLTHCSSYSNINNSFNNAIKDFSQTSLLRPQINYTPAYQREKLERELRLNRITQDLRRAEQMELQYLQNIDLQYEIDKRNRLMEQLQNESRYLNRGRGYYNYLDQSKYAELISSKRLSPYKRGYG